MISTHKKSVIRHIRDEKCAVNKMSKKTCKFCGQAFLRSAHCKPHEQTVHRELVYTLDEPDSDVPLSMISAATVVESLSEQPDSTNLDE